MPGANLDHGAGRVLGQRYRLEEAVGRGASSVVYRATDLRLQRAVAVKQVKHELSDDARFIKLFRSEAHLAGQLDHQNVVTVHDWSADDQGSDGGAYIVAEYLTGGTLRQLLDRVGVLPIRQAAVIGLQVAQGLRAAHDRGLVHRDIKPGNILFGADGRVRIADFGIARAVAEAAWTEPEGHLIGTARYAAPEQGQPDKVSSRADVYSLAICITEMVTGEVPLVGESSVATMLVRREQDLPVDPRLGPLADLIGWAGLAEWAARPSAEQMVEGLAAVCRDLPDLDPQTQIDLTTSLPAQGAIPDEHQSTVDYPSDQEWVDEPTPRRGRWRALALALFLLVVAGGAAGAWFLAGFRQPATEAVEVGLPSWEVPDFAQSDPGQEAALVAANRWTVTVTERYQDDTVAGELLSQSPGPGERFGPGIEIEVVRSLGPVPRQVPILVGLTEEEARQALVAVELVVGEVTEANSEEVEVGVVLEATIAGAPAAPDSEYVTGTAVDLLVSAGPAPRIVPNLVGSTVGGAEAALQELGLLLATTQEHSTSVPEGLIIAIAPGAGAEVSRGATVTASVSLGPPLVVVPDLTGQSIRDAIGVLEDLGFIILIDGAAEADVLGTRPVAGTSLPLGSTVTIVSTEV